MSDLSAAERIAAEALATMPGPPGITAAPRCARAVVAALSAAGWLVTPVEREPVPPLLSIDTALEDVLGEVALHLNWHHVTRQLATEQKELFADAVDAWTARLYADDLTVTPSPVDRWWRDLDEVSPTPPAPAPPASSP